MYQDDCEGVDPAVIAEYYGVEGAPITRLSHQTGAGNPGDEEDESDSQDDGDEEDSDSDQDSEGWEDVEMDLQAIAQQVGDNFQSNFHHRAVPVPKHSNPFDDLLEDDFTNFQAAFRQASQQDLIPAGYNLLPEEWDPIVGYPSIEVIKSGRRGTKELRIPLPDFIWRPRAEIWARALYVMEQIVENDS